MMGNTPNHYNAFYEWKRNLLSNKDLSHKSSFPRRLKDSFYAGEGIDLILRRKIPMPSYEEVYRLGIFKQHPINTLLGEDKFAFYYKKNPNYLWDLFTFGPDILVAVEKYGLTIDIVEGFFCLDYQGRPQLKDILRGNEPRLGALYHYIQMIGVVPFMDNRCVKEKIRGELIGAVNYLTSDYYEDEDFSELLVKLYFPPVTTIKI